MNSMKTDHGFFATCFGSLVGIYSSIDGNDLLKTVLLSALGAISSYLATNLVKRLCSKKE